MRTRALELLGADELPRTPIVRTGRRRLQLYFADPGGLDKKGRDGCELRVGRISASPLPSVYPGTRRA
jgi:hypothetical protein